MSGASRQGLAWWRVFGTMMKEALEQLELPRHQTRRIKLPEPWTRHTIQLGLNRICRRAGLRRIGAHALRHTFCSHLAMRGAAPKAIQELAGHKSMKVTMRYMHLTQSALRDAIRLLDGSEHRAATSSAPDEVTAR